MPAKQRARQRDARPESLYSQKLEELEETEKKEAQGENFFVKLTRFLASKNAGFGKGAKFSA